MDQYVRGTCEHLCSSREMQMRTKEKLLHPLEINPPDSLFSNGRPLCVAEFSRSAAGGRTPRPNALRTPAALRRTVEYLLDVILSPSLHVDSFCQRYEFVFDRLRCVRQEVVIQNLSPAETVPLLEPIVVFLAYSNYELCESPVQQFDPFVGRQHLQECLKKLLCCYDAIAAGDEDDCKLLCNRPLIESLYIVFNLGKLEAIARGFSLPKHLPNIQNCIGVSLLFHGRRFSRVLLAIRQGQFTGILACAIALKLPAIRREMLLEFASAYHSKVLTVPLQWLRELLLFEDVGTLRVDLKHYKCALSADGQAVRFQRGDFDREILAVQPRRESKLFQRHSCGINNSILQSFLVQ